MCLVAFAVGQHPRWPLVVAANRDEFLNRPTAAMGRWMSPGHEGVLAGRDLRDGGTWMGVNTLTHRTAWLTNVREPLAVNPGGTATRSRGEWVLRWLTSGDSAATLTQGSAPDEFGGFNLITLAPQGEAWETHWISNRLAPGLPGWRTERLPPGIHSLSNAALNTPWPKSLKLQAHLGRALRQADSLAALQERLLHALSDLRTAPDHRLPDTGVGLQAERRLSAIRVQWSDHPLGPYGTRSSTVIAATAQGRGEWDWHVHERVHEPPGATSLRDRAEASDGATRPR